MTIKYFCFTCLLLAFIFTGCKKTPAASKEAIMQTPTQPQTQPNEELVKEEKKAIEIPPAKNVDLDTKIGQMIMVGINDRKSLSLQDPIRKELKENKIGGIILFEKNISSTASGEKLKQLLQDFQSLSSIPLWVSIDEEGGKVHRLKEKYGFVPMPSAKHLGSMSKDSTYFYAKQLAQELSELGININFAPVVDLSLNPANTVIVKSERSYSLYPAIVTAHALSFIEAHHAHNVKTTLKHFPGHGSSAFDTHKGLVDVTRQWQFKELIPYKEIIASGKCDAIVSCHVINCHLDTTCVPSTLSKVITTELLRDILGFKGVVFSDDMQMYAISKNYGLEQSIAMAINAGVDVLVFGNNVNLSDRITASEIHAIIKKHVETGTIDKQRIDEAYQRIMTLKNTTY